VCKLH
jgi:hypothetical protein